MFYENLKAVCDEKGLKITPLVLECGGAKGSISNWKKGASPNSDIVMSLSVRLNVSTDRLLFGKEKDIPITNENSENVENTAIKTITAKEQRLLNAFRSLPIEEQYCFIGKMEQAAEIFNSEENAG